MSKFLLGAVSAIALSLSVPANGADLAARPYTKAPPPVVAAVYNWSGFYIGLNGGYGSSHKCWDFVDTAGAVSGVPGSLVSEGCHNATGGTVGGQIGYRWQSANWVFGLEGQGNWADFSGSNISNIVTFGTENRTRIDAFGLITGQVGYAWNNVLLYVKGGGAVVRDKYDIFLAGTLGASASETRWGATVGAGVEVGFAPNWTVGFEYNHIFLGHRNIDFVTPAGVFAGTDRIGQDVDMGLVRVNYRWGGPVIAKY